MGLNALRNKKTHAWNSKLDEVMSPMGQNRKLWNQKRETQMRTTK